ncbi:MAG: tRNA (adenosine(37)-N6)-threonylcarbamoyltransferase complex ATPase subunit type 1 TsaE [Cyclobacteriaceae bacterium]|nr:tRNA (adenosine(37)-N6)-threonylcarbamoyltransferase complex ATPase subunit type 1 TsaE [Cyclobacteriaceae bacterium]
MLPEHETLSFTVGPDELSVVADKTIQEGRDSAVWIFEGEFGSGKTTLIKEICKRLGVTDPVNSPSFALVNEYQRPNGDPLYHFDCYRLEGVEEALRIGIEDYLFSGYLCLIEWPQRVIELLPDQYLRMEITRETEMNRTYLISKHG